MYHLPMIDVTAFVLAGGQSSRMGSDKALLPLGEQTLLQQALRTASRRWPTRLHRRARNSAMRKFGDVIEDIYQDAVRWAEFMRHCSATSTDLNLMLSVDMPLMTSEFLNWLLRAGAARRRS